jgi:hypothetical protein
MPDRVPVRGRVVRILSYNHDFHLIKWTEIQSMEYFITWWVNSGSASLLLLGESCELLKGLGKGLPTAQYSRSL